MPRRTWAAAGYQIVIRRGQERDALRVGVLATQVFLDPYARGGNGAELVRLYVQRPFQGKGLGTVLPHRAEQTASEQGAEALWLTAWSGNRKALAFYHAHGYRTAGRSEYVFEDRTYETKILVKHLVGTE